MFCVQIARESGVHETTIYRSKELARVMLDRAVSRGEAPADIDPALALELLIAPLHFRTLLTRQPIDEHVVSQIVDLLLDGMARHT